MHCILDIDGKKWPTMVNPQESDIRAAVVSLKEDGPDFLILRRDDANMIQLNWGEMHSYDFILQEGDEKHQYQSTGRFSTDAAIQLLLTYMAGKPDWKTPADWKPY